MALLERLLGPRREQLSSYSPNKYRLSEIPGQLFSGGQRAAGVDVNQESAMSLSAVFAAVNTLSSIISTLPLSVYKKTGDRREVADSNPSHFLLHNEYNREMSAAVGRRTSEFHRLLWGNAFTKITWDEAGRASELRPIEPWRVKRERYDNGRMFYLLDGMGQIDSDSMIDETLISEDGVTGKSFIDYACGSLGLSIAAQQFSETFFGNGAKPGGMLVHPGTPDDKQRTTMREEWIRNHGGSANAHKIGVIWGGWDYKDGNQSLSPNDAQLLEVRQFTVSEVARWLNVPPHILRDLTKSSFSNIEQQSIEFVQYSLGPTLVFKEQEYDRKLLNPPNLYCKHNLAGLLRGDSVARAEYSSKMFSAGFITINEVRALDEHNPIGPDGDVHFVPVNLQPIDRAINPPEPPAPIVQAPEEEPEETPAEPTAEMRAALSSLLSSTFTRLMRKELNEGRRAAKKPGEFLAWLDSFYPEFELSLSDALASPVVVGTAMLALGFSVDEEGRKWRVHEQQRGIAKDYCKRSREALLELSGNATAANLAAKVEAEFATWEANRANDETKRILP
jgi:HK97 family phage portal protein